MKISSKTPIKQNIGTKSLPQTPSQPETKKTLKISLSPVPELQRLTTNLKLAELLTWPSLQKLTHLCHTKSSHYSIIFLRKKSTKKSSGTKAEGDRSSVKKPKPKEKLRKIHDPDDVLRVVQYRILSRILDKVPVPEYIFGFEKGKSIANMASNHVGKDVVISLDIKDFFPSIKQYMVSSLFVALGVKEDPAELLSELCTYKAYVPQGSLTAPKVSNLISAGTFGPKIHKFCQDEGLTLTIYADDITISFNRKFNGLEEAKAYSAKIIEFVTGAVEGAGFRINRKKTKIMTPHTRQWVCGAVVNSKVNLRKTERLSLRALIHNCSKNGLENEARKSNLSPEAFIRKYAGRINWFCQLNMDQASPLKAKFRKLTQPYLKLHPNLNIPELSWNSGVEDHTPKETYLKEIGVSVNIG